MADYAALKKALSEFIDPQRLIDDPLRTLAYGTDASFYRLIPQLVVQVVSEAEVVRLVQLARHFATPLTFRAAGTSLSGQAVTDSVLVVLDGSAWRDYHISEDGRFITLQPGIIGSQANTWLAPHQRKIGPDPASIATCKIGGIAANNASGMCCGVANNSYQTLESMRVVLADGSVLDTADRESRVIFARRHAGLLNRLADLSRQVCSDETLAERIRQKFSIKNTTGYSLNALVDYRDPVQILQHLMIGSEGTLGFISRITYRTVEDLPSKASALVFFADVATACRAVAALKQQPVDAVEIMDRAALRSVEKMPGLPAELAGLPDQAAALLIETRAQNAVALNANVLKVSEAVNAFATLHPLRFTDDPDECALLWKVRKGMFPSVGAVRKAGTAVVIEDVAFPLESLADATVDLQQLFVEHGYDNAIIFGHALEGNLHFVITPDFNDQTEVDRYAGFMDALCHMVVDKYDGSLKAEHSTGRNIAPFVELEWGAQAYALMQDIKQLFDPDGLLNPGVILTDDPQAHIHHLKPMAQVDPLVDRCIECGFCEPICPSRELTLTPRQRIVSLREISRLQALGEDSQRLQSLLDSFDYQGQATCAADGLCATRCPVGIDTGSMVKQLRAAHAGQLSGRVARWVDQHVNGTAKAVRIGLKTVEASRSVIGTYGLETVSQGLSRLSMDKLPRWHQWMPRATSAQALKLLDVQPAGHSEKRAVYFSACVNRSMGTASCDTESADIQQTIFSLMKKAGYSVITPPSQHELCCGQPFESKGQIDAAERAVQRTGEALWQASEQGKLPILCDTSPCTARILAEFERDLPLYEPVRFIRKFLLPNLMQTATVPSVALHVTCSARKMGLADDFMLLAQSCAEQVVLPEEEGCCGFAGDKGFVTPELNASALKHLRAQIPQGCEQGYSNSRTCEIGLSLHSGIPYRSIAYLVDACFDAAH